jgi:mono/diheme cytochrome c family protein/plastocyanin
MMTNHSAKLWFMALIGFLAAAISIPVVGKRLAPDGVVLHARMAETGGWTPEDLSVEAGKPLHLRLTSDDVMHGFAVGKNSQPAVDVIPGEFTEVSLTFNDPGRYTFYCTRWCGPNHWRMRGVIEVTGEPHTTPETQDQPLYVELGIDLDVPHPAAVTPLDRPSAASGDALNVQIPEELLDQDSYWKRSPAETWQLLRANPDLKDLSDQQIFDLVAQIARQSTNDQELETGRELYSANCAACHGEAGDGGGVMAGSLTAQDMAVMQEGSAGISGHESLPPVDFTDAASALGASPALLEGKIIRGGMGTGMPNWGPILTDEEVKALIAYLQTFQFDMER